MVQATRVRKSGWILVFLAITVLFDPLVPMVFSRGVFLALYLGCLATFLLCDWWTAFTAPSASGSSGLMSRSRSWVVARPLQGLLSMSMIATIGQSWAIAEFDGIERKISSSEGRCDRRSSSIISKYLIASMLVGAFLALHNLLHNNHSYAGGAFLRANNDRINGWMQLRSYLAWERDSEDETLELLSLLRRPKLYVFRGHAPNLIRLGGVEPKRPSNGTEFNLSHFLSMICPRFLTLMRRGSTTKYSWH
jgi:hypothetical protein